MEGEDSIELSGSAEVVEDEIEEAKEASEGDNTGNNKKLVGLRGIQCVLFVKYI